MPKCPTLERQWRAVYGSNLGRRAPALASAVVLSSPEDPQFHCRAHSNSCHIENVQTAEPARITGALDFVHRPELKTKLEHDVSETAYVSVLR
jgi:hypothetical protein